MTARALYLLATLVDALSGPFGPYVCARGHFHNWRWTERACRPLMAALVVVLLLLALTPLATYAQPAPAPPTPIAAANAEGFSVRTQLGAMVVTTSETGTGLTPMLSADAEGPLAFGEGHSAGRIGARIVLTSSPGQAAADFSNPANYKGVEVALRLGRYIGVLGSVRTALRVEYSFTTLLKGAAQARPLHGLAHSAGVGLTFSARDTAAELTVLAAFDEATTACSAPIVCTGLRSGFALVAYGQVPILDGRVLFGGDVSIAAGSAVADVQRYSVERVHVSVDPVELFRKR